MNSKLQPQQAALQSGRLRRHALGLRLKAAAGSNVAMQQRQVQHVKTKPPCQAALTQASYTQAHYLQAKTPILSSPASL
ncbi:hypothetical protein HS961_15080 [Comamonas piscis]|uniref:Uncharacterized protein n=1 Tax=Comamonas piscis TaxID=1562974 RepID=A0A7G5EJ78_9BURK|nr:hypothetical protein [Comamonas piscis]QMV74053.1 hypothetical protein HS961_15080 [Comamonas piscis]WSO32486.1 hypothetical protein VUJ63_15120 [Comamonas piscis]